MGTEINNNQWIRKKVQGPIVPVRFEQEIPIYEPLKFMRKIFHKSAIVKFNQYHIFFRNLTQENKIPMNSRALGTKGILSMA